jgi:26S proteasome non-ATPase regulatory subunit 9
MNQALVDREGFPRSDIDVVAVRTARHSIIGEFHGFVELFGHYNQNESLKLHIELTNDHKEIMKQIEQAILGLHQDNRPNPTR